VFSGGRDTPAREQDQRDTQAFHARDSSVPFRSAKWNKIAGRGRLCRLRNMRPAAIAVLARALHSVSD
jgi:hypothetical protein